MKPRRKLTNSRAIFNFGQKRALGPDESEELRRRRREGWRLDELARAYGVSTRTINRYMAAPAPFRVVIERWAAFFVIGHHDRPVQVSRWELDGAKGTREAVSAGRRSV